MSPCGQREVLSTGQRGSHRPVTAGPGHHRSGQAARQTRPAGACQSWHRPADHPALPIERTPDPAGPSHRRPGRSSAHRQAPRPTATRSDHAPLGESQRRVPLIDGITLSDTKSRGERAPTRYARNGGLRCCHSAWHRTVCYGVLSWQPGICRQPGRASGPPVPSRHARWVSKHDQLGDEQYHQFPREAEAPEAAGRAQRPTATGDDLQ